MEVLHIDSLPFSEVTNCDIFHMFRYSVIVCDTLSFKLMCMTLRAAAIYLCTYYHGLMSCLISLVWFKSSCEKCKAREYYSIICLLRSSMGPTEMAEFHKI